MPTTLINYLVAAMESRGWDQTTFADKAGLSKTTLNNIMTGRSKRPNPETLEALARALETTPSLLTALTGYSIDNASVPAEHIIRLARELSELPWLEAGIEKILQLSEEEQRDILDLIDLRIARRNPDRKGRN